MKGTEKPIFDKYSFYMDDTNTVYLSNTKNKFAIKDLNNKEVKNVVSVSEVVVDDTPYLVCELLDKSYLIYSLSNIYNLEVYQLKNNKIKKGFLNKKTSSKTVYFKEDEKNIDKKLVRKILARYKKSNIIEDTIEKIKNLFTKFIHNKKNSISSFNKKV